MRIVIALSVLLMSCGYDITLDYPHCASGGLGGVVCAAEIHQTPINLGVKAWRESYSVNWPADRLDEVLAKTAVHYGDLSNNNDCDCMSDEISCVDADPVYFNVCVKGYDKEGNRYWYPESALIHELTHVGAWWVDGHYDDDHDERKLWEGNALYMRATYLWEQWLRESNVTNGEQ